MVVPAFGFSAGDFIAAINLLTKVAKSLREATGATAEYRQATADLNHVLSVLRTVQSLDDSKAPRHIVDKIQLCSHACYVPLASFLEKLKKFDILSAVPGRRAPGLRSLARGSRKVQWALLIEEDIKKLHASLAPQLAVIEILLQLSSVEQLSGICKTTNETQRDLQTLLQNIDQVKNTLLNNAASKKDIDRLEFLLQGVSLQQNRGNDAVLSLTQSSALTTRELVAKIGQQEATMNVLLQKINTHLIANTPLSPSPDSSGISNSDKQPATEADGDGTGCQGQDLSLSTHAHRLWLAGRSGIAETMLVLLCMLPVIQRLFRSLMTLARSPSLLLDSNINLEDALGRTLSLPFEHFRYWSVMESRLREAFSGLPGEDKVLRGEFQIMSMRDNGNSVLTKEVWSQAVRPGSRLAMSILFQKIRVQQRACPVCSYANNSTHWDVWVQW